MTETEIAWLSGWLEGEGYFSCARNTPTIQVTSTDLDIIERAAKLMSVTKISPVKKQRETNKQAHRICLHGKNAVNIMTQIRPLMGDRRGEVIDHAINFFEGKEERCNARKNIKRAPSVKMSETMKKRWANPTYREHMTKVLSDARSSIDTAEVGRKSWAVRKNHVQRNFDGRFI